MLRSSLLMAVTALGLPAAALAQSTTINGGGATSSQPTYDAEFTAYTNANPSILFSYDGVGSAGQTAFLTDNIALFNKPTAQYGTIVGSTVHFAASDSVLSASQVSGYTRASIDGALIQVPTIGVGVTVPYVNSGLTSSLPLTDAQLCGVISGQITNWNQLSSKATPGAIVVVYRADTSAATFLLAQHLNAACTSANSSFPAYPVPITNSFPALFGGTVPAGFVGATGSSGMQSTLLNTPLSLGYVSPDYTSIAPNSPNTSTLKVASLVNPTDGKAYQPTVNNINLGLNSPGAGATNSTPPSTKTAAANPLNWVPTVPVTTAGYDIVGYSSWDLSSCYADKTIGSNLIAILKDNYTNSAYKTIVTNSGATPLANTKAVKYVTAVTSVFLSNKSRYGLDIDDAKTCKGLPGR